MQEQCNACPTGHYCLTASTSPLECQYGTYTGRTKTEAKGSNAGPPSTSWPACTQCPAGHWCKNATVTPTKCGRGEHSTPGSSSCSVCQVGHFCGREGTTTAGMLANNRCAAGLWCPAGKDRVPDKTNEPCPTGRWCVEATVAPQGCKAGTYNPLYGRPSEMDACLACPAGRYCHFASSNITGYCAPGHYCPAGSTTPTQHTCPERYVEEALCSLYSVLKLYSHIIGVLE